MKYFLTSITKLSKHLTHIRYDIARASNNDTVTYFESKPFDFILVVEGRATNHHATNSDWR